MSEKNVTVKREEEAKTVWEFGTHGVTSFHDRKDKVVVFCNQHIWERDKKPSIEMNIGSKESGYWWLVLTPSAARELAKSLINAVDFHTEFKPGVGEEPHP